MQESRLQSDGASRDALEQREDDRFLLLLGRLALEGLLEIDDVEVFDYARHYGG